MPTMTPFTRPIGWVIEVTGNEVEGPNGSIGFLPFVLILNLKWNGEYLGQFLARAVPGRAFRRSIAAKHFDLLRRI
jgi:hypothetical protein